MRKLSLVALFVLIFAAFPSATIAQEEQTLDLQLWSKTTAEGTDVFPWLMYYGKKGLVVDLRHNYDAPKTFGAYIGKQFGGEKLFVIPEVGYLGGDFAGFSPEIYVGASKGRLIYFSQWQWAASLRHEDNSWGYQYNDLIMKIAGPVSLGVDSQTFWEKNTVPVNTDIGPVLKIGVGKNWSARVWYAKRSFGADRGDWVMYCNIGKIVKW